MFFFKCAISKCVNFGLNAILRKLMIDNVTILSQNPVDASSNHIEVIDCFIFKMSQCESVPRLDPFEWHKDQVCSCAPGVVEVFGHSLVQPPILYIPPVLPQPHSGLPVTAANVLLNRGFATPQQVQVPSPSLAVQLALDLHHLPSNMEGESLDHLTGPGGVGGLFYFVSEHTDRFWKQCR